MVSETAPRQLSLGISLNDEATFENFYTVADSNNAQIVDALRRQARAHGETFIYLWAGRGAGATHLLQAACHEADACGFAIQYLPLCDLAGFAPEALLEGFESLDLICLDGLQRVVGNPDWELALFDLFNRLRDSGGRLLVAADRSPRELDIHLADLKSRLSWGVVYQADPIRDGDRRAALQLRARARGLELSDEVAHFILHRAPRAMNELFTLLERLDDASLAERRRLTIPFVKRVLGW